MAQRSEKPGAENGAEQFITFSPDNFSIGDRQPKQPAPGSDVNG